MTKLINLKIENYRGIQNLSIDFDITKNLICFIGRGDSGKSTLLEAISAVLSPSWNLNFNDTDFHYCNPENSIKIEASLIGIPSKLLSEEKFGLYLRGFNAENSEITDEVLDDVNDTMHPTLTIRLVVDETLEPQWTITNSREQEDKPISAADRALLNCHMISDYLDRHFSWNKGNPLYALLKITNTEEVTAEKNVVLQSTRVVKSMIDEYKFEEFNQVIDIIKTQAASFGLDINNTETTLDFKELSIKDGRVSLHEDAVPFRLKGKGSKRLASLAIQTSLIRNGGIMLVDEVEQGLEPDRAKQVVRTLKNDIKGQIFLTTHSREIITELEASDLLLIIKDPESARTEPRQLSYNKKELQAAVRACSEAFFAKKVIVCEGKTEVGICRALDKYRKLKGLTIMSFSDCAYVLGEGHSLVSHSKEINEAKFKTALFCDSDEEAINNKKADLVEVGIDIFDCANTNNIETQTFHDLPWEAIKELINYALDTRYNGAHETLIQSLVSKYPEGIEFPANDAFVNDTPEMRAALASVSSITKKEWFKRTDHGEFLGNIIFKYIDAMDNESHLKKILLALSEWIDK